MSNLRNILIQVRKDKDKYYQLVKTHKTPFYVFDKAAFTNSINYLRGTFKKYIPEIELYYPVKLNHYKGFIREGVKANINFDVASIREMEMALKYNPNRILYYAPGKTVSDLNKAIQYKDKVTIIIDSFSEAELLESLLAKRDETIRCGVRINIPSHGEWTKYGIKIDNLANFIKEFGKSKYIKLEGIHFHTSRNRDSKTYVESIKEIGTYLKNEIDPEFLKGLAFFDFGGGFEIQNHEGYFKDTKNHLSYDVLEPISIEEYAKDIGNAIDRYLRPIINVKYYTEAGRYLCSGSMHIVMKVTDVKTEDSAITDAGVNMVGWQRFQFEYFPLINLSSSSNREIPFNMYGNLCTTWDIWGYQIYATTVNKGDIIVVPNQGALTYTLAQNFIFKIPNVYEM